MKKPMNFPPTGYVQVPVGEPIRSGDVHWEVVTPASLRMFPRVQTNETILRRKSKK